MMKIMFVYGTRPEFIKIAPVVREFKKNGNYDVKVCCTGQHTDLLTGLLSIFDLQNDYNLNVMEPGQSLSKLASKILSGLDPMLTALRLDCMFVHGDTTTATYAALAAFNHRIPVWHIEAGLRTGDLGAPWPEEANRALISRVADMNLAPTEAARRNLIKENIPDEKIIVTGNTVVDALEYTSNKIRNDDRAVSRVKAKIQSSSENSRFALITIHRRENMGAGIENICQAIEVLANLHKQIDFVIPVHLNPNVREIIIKKLSDKKNVLLIDHMNYEEFIYLMKTCEFILSDSGGIQEEAPTFNKKIFVLRETTERPEGVDAGFAELVGSKCSKIINAVNRYISISCPPVTGENPYGDGLASGRISFQFEKTDLKKT